MRSPRRMRGLHLRRETPHPPSLREGTLSHKGRGEKGRAAALLTQFDLVGDVMRQADAADGQNNLGRQLLVALESSGLDRIADRLFDFALRCDADFFQELAQAGVEDVFVHEDLLITLDHTLISALHEPSSFEA